MVRTHRQQASFDEAEEEAEFYHRTDLEQNGMEAERIDCTMGRTNDEEGDFKRQIQDLRIACASEKFQNNYLIYLTNKKYKQGRV